MYQVDFTRPCHAHFIGIGGISMSGLAEILKGAGFTVTGSDLKASSMTRRLESMGIQVIYGQKASNITDDIDFVVYTAAIHPDNEEFKAVQEKNLPMLTRAQLLGEIMSHYPESIAVSGTHGKTTTTAMISEILLASSKDPTISIGGMLDSIGGNIRVGQSPYFVTEACEYTNSFHALHPLVNIILNVDNDHLDFFHNIENIAASFATFAGNTLDGGILIVNGDMKYTEQICSAVKGRNVQVVTFGLSEQNTYQAADIQLNELGQASYTLKVNGVEKEKVILSVTGAHNAVNSLSAIAAADFLGLPSGNVLEGLRKCKSAERRFQFKGTLPGNITVIDDYAHHPTEIAASLKVARSIARGEIWCAFQPHTYSRTRALLPQFAEALSLADHVLLADIYAAREKDDGTISSRDLEKALKEKGTDAMYLGDFQSIEDYFRAHMNNNDLFITMGAGNIDSVGTELLKSQLSTVSTK